MNVPLLVLVAVVALLLWAAWRAPRRSARRAEHGYIALLVVVSFLLDAIPDDGSLGKIASVVVILIGIWGILKLRKAILADRAEPA